MTLPPLVVTVVAIAPRTPVKVTAPEFATTGSENVSSIAALRETPAAPSAGVVETSVGAVVSLGTVLPAAASLPPPPPQAARPAVEATPRAVNERPTNARRLTSTVSIKVFM